MILMRDARLLACLTWLVLLAPLLLAGRIEAQEGKLPPPVEVELKDKNGSLLSRDGVELKATFFPGTREKESVPVIMVHEYKGSRADFHELAEYLQREHGCAVLIPDLRGHGKSTSVAGSSVSLDPDRLPPEHFNRMVLDDMEACKKFLLERHNAGELNIDKLVVVGAEMGAVIAMNWAKLDWSWPTLVTGKQGQDVKALVLLSPEWSIEKGRLHMGDAATDRALQKRLSVYILYGDKQAGSIGRDAERIYRALKASHVTSGKEQDLFLAAVKTSLQGTEMLKVPELGIARVVGLFIQARVGDKTYPWQERGNPVK